MALAQNLIRSIFVRYAGFTAFIMVLVCMLAMHPFDWPLQSDRGFLVYMAQVISRGEALYQATPFGYTPLSAWLGGAWIAITKSVLPLPGYMSIRILGILMYALTGPAIYHMCLSIFNDRNIAWAGVVLHAGFATPMMIGCMNAEPKTLIMLFAPLAILMWNTKRHALCGLFAGLCILSWQPAGLYGLGLLIATLVFHKHRWRKATLMLAGGMIPMLTLVIYLLASDSVTPAWNQLIIKHLLNEASELGDAPLRWMTGLLPGFATEIGHFVLAIIGIAGIFMSRSMRNSLDRDTLGLVGILSSLWMIFQGLEYTAFMDYLPMLALVVIWALVPIAWVLRRIRFPKWVVVAIIALYSLGDIVFMTPKYTLQQQEEVAQQIKSKYPDRNIIVAKAEFLYVLWEEAIPMKFIRHHLLEAPVVDLEGGCETYTQQISALEPLVLVASDIGRRKLHPCAAAIFNEHCPDPHAMKFKENLILHPIRRLNKKYISFKVYDCDEAKVVPSGH